MREILSFALFAVLIALTAGALFIVARNELETKDKATGGYGLPVIVGFILIFLIMPVFSYFVRF